MFDGITKICFPCVFLLSIRNEYSRTARCGPWECYHKLFKRKLGKHGGCRGKYIKHCLNIYTLFFATHLLGLGSG